MPGTSQTAICGQDPVDQGSSVMGALCTKSLDLAAIVEEEDLGVEAFNLDLLLGAWLEVQRGDALELIFLGHGFWRGGAEICTGQWSPEDGGCSGVNQQGLDGSGEGDWSGAEADGMHEA